MAGAIDRVGRSQTLAAPASVAVTNWASGEPRKARTSVLMTAIGADAFAKIYNLDEGPGSTTVTAADYTFVAKAGGPPYPIPASRRIGIIVTSAGTVNLLEVE